MDKMQKIEAITFNAMDVLSELFDKHNVENDWDVILNVLANMVGNSLKICTNHQTDDNAYALYNQFSNMILDYYHLVEKSNNVKDKAQLN